MEGERRRSERGLKCSDVSSRPEVSDRRRSIVRPAEILPFDGDRFIRRRIPIEKDHPHRLVRQRARPNLRVLFHRQTKVSSLRPTFPQTNRIRSTRSNRRTKIHQGDEVDPCSRWKRRTKVDRSSRKKIVGETDRTSIVDGNSSTNIDEERTSSVNLPLWSNIRR